MIVATVIFHPVFFLPGRLSSLKQVWLACCFVLTVGDVIAVEGIEIAIGQLKHKDQSVADIRADLQINPDSSLDMDLNARVLGESLALKGKLQNGYWQVSTVLKTTVADLLQNDQRLVDEEARWQIEGRVEMFLSISGTVVELSQPRVSYRLVLNNLTGELPDIATAFEALDITITGEAGYRQSRLEGHAILQLNSGLLAYDDLLLEPVAGTIDIRSQFILDKHHVQLTSFRLDDPGGLHVKMPLLKADTIHYLDQHEIILNVEARSLLHVYKVWAQPLLYGTVLEDIDVDGSLTASISFQNKAIKHIAATLDNISLSDRAGRFSVAGLSGHLNNWDRSGGGQLDLSWQGAELYRLPLGPSDFELDIKDGGFTITSPFTVPLYDGELKIFKLSAEGLQTDQPNFIFDGTLTPVGLGSLSHSMGWPAFRGSISGVIPNVRYDNSALIIDGVLLVKVFDGTLKIQNLRISDLLSPLPRLSADVTLDQLDLEKLTQAFDFGRIEGRMSGHVTGLSMVAWEANAFDARFYTPQDDKSRRIISQRAVDNLTSLSGSDISSVLSRSYLRFFEDFRYDRLGISCILKNNICRMSGIEATSDRGYYIVKGGLFPPRLDIIGYSHEVDWQELLDRLKRVMSDNTPVIQ